MKIGKAEATLQQPHQQQSQTKHIMGMLQSEICAFNQNLKEQINLFQAGQTKHFLTNWKSFTSDHEILEAVSGLQTELEGIP